jgi:hypothetical protein
MRTFLSSLIPLALLFTVDVDVATQTVGFSEAQAAEFTGRIKNVRIKRRRVGSGYRVVTQSSSTPGDLPSTIQVSLEAREGAAPGGLTSDLAEGVRDDVRYGFAVPEGVGLRDLMVVVSTSDASTELALEELFAGAEEGGFGPDVAVNGAEAFVRARETVDADGLVGLDVRVLSRRGTSLETLEDVVLKSFEDPTYFLDAQEQSTVRVYEVAIDENPDDPLLGSYTAQAIWRDATGAVVDETQFVLDVGAASEGPRVERVALRASSRGTVLVTRVSTPDASPVLLEASVTEADGSAIISMADEAPQWTERQFTAPEFGFEEDPTGSSYLAQMTAVDAEGNPIGQQFEVELFAEQPDENGEINTTLFAEDQSQIALIPGEEEGSWQVLIRTVEDAPANGYNVIFEEPFEGPAPLETEINSELSRVWRQFRQRDSTPAEGDAVRQVSVIVNPDSEAPAAASGLEAEGALMRSGRSVEDIDGFLASVSGTSGIRSKIRARKSRRIVRR